MAPPGSQRPIHEEFEGHDEREPGLDVVGHRADVGRIDAEGEPAQAQGPADLLVEHLAQAAPVGVTGHHLHHEAADHGVVGGRAADDAGWLQIADHLLHPVGIGQQVQVERLAGQGGYPGPVAQHLTDRDVVLAVPGEVGHVIGDAVVERKGPQLFELVHDHGRHGLGRREQVDRRVQLHRDGLVGVEPPAGPDAAGVADRPVHDDVAVVADAHLDAGVHAGSVDRLDPRARAHRRPRAVRSRRRGRSPSRGPSGRGGGGPRHRPSGRSATWSRTVTPKHHGVSVDPWPGTGQKYGARSIGEKPPRRGRRPPMTGQGDSPR